MKRKIKGLTPRRSREIEAAIVELSHCIFLARWRAIKVNKLEYWERRILKLRAQLNQR
jgi:hypothetical protein